MNWEPIYALLIFFSTLITYSCSLGISKTKERKKKKAWVVLSVTSNFLILFLFKYYNFLTQSIIELLTLVNLRIEFPEFKVLLPIGISFYTFQAVGYSIDVYRDKLAPETHFGKYALFVSFFPQLVAGPIERAKNLLPQINRKLPFDAQKATDGIKLIIWGYFMKVVVANRLALYVDSIYENVAMHNSPSLILGTIFFSFQIYCDFAGYSSIAIGCAKILGFDLMTNFRRPYFAKSIREFWQRWHISLSLWFKDYVFVPLALRMNRKTKGRKKISLITTFLINGLWHGANWTFVFWGLLNGIYLLFENAFQLKPIKIKGFKTREAFYVFKIIALFSFTGIFFRANSFSEALIVIQNIFIKPGPLFIGGNAAFIYSWIGILIIIAKDIYDEYDLSQKLNPKKIHKYLWHISIVLLILLIGAFDGGQFIYFQF